MPVRPVPAGDAQARGRWAEQRVVWWYRWRGWRLVARNWLGGGGELDAVFSRWRTLLVVEVRYRSRDDAFASVDDAKWQRTLRAAQSLQRSYHLERYRLRVDVAAVGADGRVRVHADLAS